MVVSEASADVDTSDELPELASLEPELELDDDDDDDASAAGGDVGPPPKLVSAGAVGLQASAGSSAIGAIRRTRSL